MGHRIGANHRGDLLLVDDTPENLGFLAAMLKRAGYRCRAVPSGALALRAAAAEVPDLVLLDITMPGMDGYEVCRRFKASEALRDVPIIFLSALADTTDKVTAFAAGGIDYVTKPYQVEEIGARVETHLSLRRLQRQLEAKNEELARSNARLERLEQVRQGLVQMLVHDLKNPLAVVQSLAQAARAELATAGEPAQTFEEIEHMSKVMTRMVLDVLDVAHAGEAGLAPRLAPEAPWELLGEARDEMRAMASAAGKLLVVEAAPDLPPRVTVDRELFRRLLENLLDNALKYAPRGTAVRLELGGDGPHHYRVAVRDEGPGVPTEMRERIFEPYARLDRDVARSARVSRGLGLAFCKLAAECLGGRVWVEDNVPAGSAFVVRLPIGGRR
jgi:two-component system sensor histidine kinase/response regulator